MTNDKIDNTIFLIILQIRKSHNRADQIVKYYQ